MRHLAKIGLVFIGLIMIPKTGFSQISIDVSAIQRLMELKNLVEKAKNQLVQLKNGNKINNRTQANTQSILNLGKEVEEILRDISEFENLVSKNGKYKFNDLSIFMKTNQAVSSKLSDYHKQLTFLNKLDQILSQNSQGEVSQQGGQQMYDFFYDGTSPELSASNHDDFAKAKKDEFAKVYGLQNTMQKKKFQTALAYYKIADELYHQAIVLSNAVSDESNGKPMRISNSSPFSLDNVFGTDDSFDIGSLFGGDVFSNSMGGLMTAIYMSMPDEVLQQEILRIKAFIRAIEEIEPTGYEGIIKRANRDLEDANNAYQYKMTQKVNQASGTYPGVGLNPSNPSGFSISKTGLRMSTGERIQAQTAAIHLMNESTDYKEKGDKLMEDATKKTPLQQEMESRYQAKLVRNSLAKIKF